MTFEPSVSESPPARDEPAPEPDEAAAKSGEPAPEPDEAIGERDAPAAGVAEPEEPALDSGEFVVEPDAGQATVRIPVRAHAPHRRALWPRIAGGFTAAVLLGGIAAFTLNGPGAIEAGATAAELDANQRGDNAVTGAMGEPARDGGFEFTVTAMTCGGKRVGPAEYGAAAQGEFCLIDLTVTNIGASATAFLDIPQLARDAEEGVHHPDTVAGTWANQKHPDFTRSIGPGHTVKGRLVFDVPRGTRLTTLVLHEVMFSRGVRVPLRHG
ncbi:hypothetical protein AMIS_47920 [Actinoplanes missouriensis 431]|uniref:DUF4352 domain-containing protein n=1 Tax=Actinoplanes missouriensis (strain ATCC 14538 / DSM 43046 / CBS 188.64 / JCM 3121 / NBRC 102363 / NCIMB 12654 / NRRL B-3342 / UNCC 431) TaxID=512565 RepID=I0HAH5_ACTM4|nr:DUF4352 domain-containing protein [Actinoplanes missouriensis]BAL90012.1 hypothetical protein AMIS_47920 [Actinoplanes missouriensis 431]